MAASAADRYGVMGYPVSHSRSPVIHRLFAMQTGQNIQYELLQVKPENLATAVHQFQRTGGKGLNITLPHKSAVVGLVDKLSERAQTAGAINTIAFEDDGLFGDNTDGVGLIRDLGHNLGVRLRDSDILILGAGGATRGILAPLLAAGPGVITDRKTAPSRGPANLPANSRPAGMWSRAVSMRFRRHSHSTWLSMRRPPECVEKRRPIRNRPLARLRFVMTFPTA